MGGESGSTTVIYQIDNSGVESLLTEQNELLTEQHTEIIQYLEAIEGATIATVAMLGLLCGIVLGIAVARLFYSLWRT